MNSDRQLAEELVEGCVKAVSTFEQRFDDVIRHAVNEASANYGLACSAKVAIRHVGHAVGSGYLDLLKTDELTLGDYLASLRLGDLLLAAACVCNDNTAWQALQSIIEKDVSPALVRNWTSRVGSNRIEETVLELGSHCYTAATKGNQKGLARVSSFRGRSSIRTWLYAMAVRLLIDHQRGTRHIQSIGSAGQQAVMVDSSRPDVVAAAKEAVCGGADLRLSLIDALRSALDGMPARRRLAAVLHYVSGYRPSEVAERMRVSRPRITELLSQATRDLTSASHEVCLKIADLSERSLDEVQQLLATQLATVMSEASAGREVADDNEN